MAIAKWRLSVLAVLLSIAGTPQSVLGGGRAPQPAYFYISEGEDKCFVSNAPAEVPLTVTYHNRESQGVTCSIGIRDPKDAVVFNRMIGHVAPRGQMSYLTKIAGDHRVCISCPASQWFATSKVKWSLSVELGESEATHSDVAKRGNINELETSLNSILRRLDVLAAENMYQKSQEETFFATGESINFRFLGFSILKIGSLLGCTFMSVYHLTKFFHTQKLI